MSKIKICSHTYKFGNGFHITFENGVKVSVQLGAGTYSDNFNLIDNESFMRNKLHPSYGKECESSTVEIMIWDKEHNIITDKYKDGDSVLGYIGMNEVVEVLKWARDYE